MSAVSERDLKAVVKKLLTLAKRGNIAAIRELLDRTLGKSATALEQLGDDTAGKIQPIVEIIVADRAEALHFNQIREQLRQAGASVAFTGLPAPPNDETQ